MNDHPMIPDTMGSAVAISDEQFDGFVKDNRVVLVDFWAEWCGPCKRLDPILDALAVKYDGKVAFAKVDVDAHPVKMQSFGIMGIPTMLLFKDGQLAERI